MVRSQLDTMTRNQIRRLPVIEEHMPVGMISEADLARGLSEDQLSRFAATVSAG